MCSKHEGILTDGEEESHQCVGPVRKLDGPEEIGVIIRNDITLCAGNQRRDREPERREKETLAFVGKRCSKCTAVEEEAKKHTACDGGEEDQVDHVNGHADAAEAWELKRLSKYQEC